MTTVLQTPRLYLREPKLDDAEEITRYLRRNKIHDQAFEPKRSQEYYTQHYWRERIMARQKEAFDKKGCQLFIYAKDNPDAIVGYINFDNIIRGCFQSCTLGYALDFDNQGQGYMHEALKVSINYIFSTHNLHRIQANYIHTNTKSGNILEKLKFRKEGEAKKYLNINGEWQDHVLTSLININYVDSN